MDWRRVWIRKNTTFKAPHSWGFLFVGWWVDLGMRRYIVLLLITGTVWAQTGLNKLVLKNGNEYLGEYLRTEKNIIYFKPQDALSTQPASVKLIQELKLKDGTILTNDILGFRAYAKLNIEEKAVYNNLKKRQLRQFYYFATIFALIPFILIVKSRLGGSSGSSGKVFLGDGPPI